MVVRCQRIQPATFGPARKTIVACVSLVVVGTESTRASQNSSGAKYPEHLAEFIFALNTGLRLSSQYSVTYGMIDWTRNVLDIPRTKNDEPVHVPLNSDVLAAAPVASVVARAQRAGLSQSEASREARFEQRSLV